MCLYNCGCPCAKVRKEAKIKPKRPIYKGSEVDRSQQELEPANRHRLEPIGVPEADVELRQKAQDIDVKLGFHASRQVALTQRILLSGQAAEPIIHKAVEAKTLDIEYGAERNVRVPNRQRVVGRHGVELFPSVHA